MIDFTRERGLEIPDDISLVSFGDTRALRLIGRGIDSIALPVDRMAEFIEPYCIQPPGSQAGRQMTVDFDFIRHGSSAEAG